MDLKTKSVFNGSDLGKEYSAKDILERLGYSEKISKNSRLIPNLSGKLDDNNEFAKNGSRNDLTDILLRPEYVDGNLVPYPFKKYIKRKKKRLFYLKSIHLFF